jgi:hypothetical protein
VITFFDSISSPETTGSPIPAQIMGGEAIAGYIAGNSWPTYEPYRRARPELAVCGRVLSITLTARAVARCLDIEPGGAVNADAAGWLRHYADRTWGRPWLYTYASNVRPLLVALAGAGVDRSEFLLWSAHPAPGEHLCDELLCGFPAADATQFAQTPDGRCDISVARDYCFPSGLAAVGTETEDRMAISAIVREDGRIEVFVEARSGEVFHAWQDKPAGGWHGARAGERMAEWVPLGTPGAHDGR